MADKSVVAYFENETKRIAEQCRQAKFLRNTERLNELSKEFSSLIKHAAGLGIPTPPLEDALSQHSMSLTYTPRQALLTLAHIAGFEGYISALNGEGWMSGTASGYTMRTLKQFNDLTGLATSAELEAAQKSGEAQAKADWRASPFPPIPYA